ncbi:MAG: TonB-dependent receptor [Helicobacteraceae bacterium]|nr:TonB-dependent receptor [Helicobacteraceae bacterium]
MRTSKNSILLASLLSLALTTASAENLGTISVESSTIDDRFDSKRSEVSSTATISAEKIDELHAENIQQILQQIPGITTESTTGDSLKIHIRGVENQMYMGEKPGVAIVIDGVPVFERTGRVNIDMDNIESIKVIKGGASFLFGDDALAGAVIITTKKGAKYARPFGSVELGSHGYRKLVARAGHANKDMNFHLQASQRKGDGYHDKADYNTKYLNGKLQYYIDDTSDLTFGTEYSKRKKDSHGTVGGATEAENNPQSIYNGVQASRDYTRNYDVDLFKLFTTYSKDLEGSANLLFNAYIYTDTTTYMSAPQTKDATDTRQSSYSDDDYLYDNNYDQIQRGLKSEYRDSFGSSAALIGVDIRNNEYKNKVTYRVEQAKYAYPRGVKTNVGVYSIGEDKSNNKTNEQVYALYGEYKYAFNEKISATANLRNDLIKLDYLDSTSNEFKKDFSVYSYRVGSDYQLSDASTIFLNVSTGFRAPTINQLYAGSVSTYGSTQNNPDLKPEQSQNYEIGIRGKVENITFESSIFQLDRNNFIMKTSGNYGDTDTVDMWDNIGGATNRGLELSANSDIVEKLNLNVAYTYLDAKYTDYTNYGMALGRGTWDSPAAVQVYDVTGNRIPRTSEHTVNVILDYQASKEIKMSTEVNAKSSYFADDLNQIEIPGYATLNLVGSYKIKIKEYDCNFFARVNNAFDKKYYQSARTSSDRNEDGFFNDEDLSITVAPGRVVSAGLSVKF